MKNIKIVVATHKKYIMPEDSLLYFPIQSGSFYGDDLGYQRDNVGENISEKNIEYNELCAMYWAWKNIDADYIGLVHYRRYFSCTSKREKSIDRILNRKTIERLLQNDSIILPHKNIYPNSIENHYIHSYAGNKKLLIDDISSLKRAVSKVTPDYEAALYDVLKSHSAHMYHMCIMKKDFYKDYCNFMFSVIFEVERIRGNRIPSDRYIGGLSEFLLDVWLYKNKYSYIELGLVELERENKVKRLFRVLKRMFIKNDYIWDEKRIERNTKDEHKN